MWHFISVISHTSALNGATQKQTVHKLCRAGTYSGTCTLYGITSAFFLMCIWVLTFWSEQMDLHQHRLVWILELDLNSIPTIMEWEHNLEIINKQINKPHNMMFFRKDNDFPRFSQSYAQTGKCGVFKVPQNHTILIQVPNDRFGRQVEAPYFEALADRD